MSGGSTPGFPEGKPRTLNQVILLALYDALGRTGVSDIEVGWLDDSKPYHWWAKANWGGTRVTAEHHADPVWALFEIAMRVLNGGECAHCHRAVAFGYLNYATDGETCDRPLVLVEEGRMEFVRACEVSDA